MTNKMKEQQTIFLTDFDIEELCNGRSITTGNKSILITFDEHSKRALK